MRELIKRNLLSDLEYNITDERMFGELVNFIRNSEFPDKDEFIEIGSNLGISFNFETDIKGNVLPVDELLLVNIGMLVFPQERIMDYVELVYIL